MRILIAALLLSLLGLPSLPAFAKENDSVFDKVIKTQTIRCGYGTVKPWIYQDATTGKMTGLIVNIMEEIARQLKLKLEWPEETGWASLPTALESGKVDVGCSALWRDPSRASRLAFTRPIFYSAMHAYARENDKRFTGKKDELNQPGIKIIVQDGDYSAALADRDFPKAEKLSLTTNNSEAEKYLNVVQGKADVVFAEPMGINDFNNGQKGVKLKRVPFKEPLSVYAASIPVNIHEPELKEMLDTTIAYLLDTGRIQAMMKEFQDQYPDAILAPVKPYEEGPQQ